jgi:23S rRNA (uracil1939-C5)-methyltransferase
MMGNSSSIVYRPSSIVPIRATKMNEELITLDLTEMAQTGEAIGRADGVVFFVPFGLPGDRAEVVVTERKRTFARGRLLRLLYASPQRIEPSCPYFTICGGCEWQHIPYAQQLLLKENNVRTQLTRIGKLVDPTVLHCLPSPSVYGYRNHARLQRTAGGKIGYRAARSHEIVAVEQCPILEPALNAELQHLAVAGVAAGRSEIQLRVAMPLTIGDHRYQVAPDGFFQANTAVSVLLVNEVLRALTLSGKEQILELYSGMGLFTVPIAERVGRVVAVESHVTATADAHANVLRAGLAHRVELVTAPVEQALRQKAITQRKWDAIVLDPPRAGITSQALSALLDLAPPKIVYVSCDPATLARDAHLLCADGYRLHYAQPLDMFPQTHHVETVALFARQ